MRLAVVLMLAMCLFAAMAMAGPKQIDVKASKKKPGYRKVCLKGRKKNGKCITGKLRVRSADSDDFYEIPNVEDVHWGELDEE
ncbi:hypothetical protein Q7P37_005196 [Cladosporium fusiforme]